jgi:hypothetical protein
MIQKVHKRNGKKSLVTIRNRVTKPPARDANVDIILSNDLDLLRVTTRPAKIFFIPRSCSNFFETKNITQSAHTLATICPHLHYHQYYANTNCIKQKVLLRI